MKMYFLVFLILGSSLSQAEDSTGEVNSNYSQELHQKAIVVLEKVTQKVMVNGQLLNLRDIFILQGITKNNLPCNLYKVVNYGQIVSFSLQLQKVAVYGKRDSSSFSIGEYGPMKNLKRKLLRLESADGSVSVRFWEKYKHFSEGSFQDAQIDIAHDDMEGMKKVSVTNFKNGRANTKSSLSCSGPWTIGSLQN